MNKTKIREILFKHEKNFLTRRRIEHSKKTEMLIGTTVFAFVARGLGIQFCLHQYCDYHL